VLVHCHAGCSQDEVIDALRAKGLWEPKPNGSAGPSARRRGKIVATYDYVTEQGELAYQVVRFDPKDFRQRRPDGDGWQWNLRGVTRIPYRLPEILATSPRRGILIVEGEKDADNLAAIGVVATTCAGGAERWQQSYNPYFRGRPVYIVPDNDDVGRSHADQVAAQLAGTAASVKIITLPNLGQKQDVSDWLAAGNTKADLVALVKQAPDWTPPQPDSPQPASVPDTQAATPAPTDDWRTQIMVKDDGETILSNIHNAQLLLSYHSDLEGVLGFNQFTKSVDILKQPPWETELAAYPRSLTDVDDTRATAWLERHGCKLTISNVHNAIISAAHHNPFHPLQDYLNGLQWDGEARLSTALSRYFGCETSDYTAAVSRKFFVGSVARGLTPGCKNDTMLILEGPQGLKKSTAVAELFHDDWFSDELSDLGSKDASMQLQGVWCIELAELATMWRAESNRLKEFLSRREDRFRPPYGRNVVCSPRQCVFVGTVNPEGGYLKDATGARRFWPVRCKDIQIDLIRAERDQLWAEAVEAYRAGERWWFDLDEQHIAEAQQAARYESDPWHDQVLNWAEQRAVITVSGVMSNCLDLPSSQQTQVAQTRIAKILVSCGWQRVQRRVQGRRSWVYVTELENGSLSG